MIRTEYHKPLLDGLYEPVNELIPLIKRSKLRFSHIAVTGVSGIIGGIIAHKLKKKLIVVRTGENSREYICISATGICSTGKIDGWIIINDLIQSGKTVDRILSSVRNETDEKCLGIFTYSKNNEQSWAPRIYYGFYQGIEVINPEGVSKEEGPIAKKLNEGAKP